MWLLGLVLAVLFTSVQGFCAAPFVFSNPAPIGLVESGVPPTPASLYPSSVTVSGLTGWKVAKATVTLHGLSHTFPSDISMLLLGPQGQGAFLMAQTGGQNRYSVTNLTLTLDDDATNPLPIYTSLSSGTFRPTDGYLVLGYPHFPYDFPTPAPAGNSNSPALLSAFKNTDPNGVWSLFVVDDSAGDTGSIAGGWSLSVTIGVPLQIVQARTNVVLSWPLVAANCTLQSATGLGPGVVWSNVSTAPITNAGRLMVTNLALQRSTYFRLIGP
jgi:subtilisin-like proprotein convertase family protein